MTSEQIKLLPCPFCGSDNIEALDTFNFVACQNCGASLEDVEPSAHKLWNTRSASKGAPTMTGEQMEELADDIEFVIVNGLSVHTVSVLRKVQKKLRTASTPAQSDEQSDRSWIGLSASEKAAYDWPDDSDLHRQCRAAYVAGAIDYARPSAPAQSSAVPPPLIGTPVYGHSDGAFYGESSRPSLVVPPEVQDTYLVGGPPDLMAMSGSVLSDRIIQLHFRRKVTDDDRKWLLDAINMKLASPPSGEQPVESNPPSFDGTTYGDPFQPAIAQPSSENTVQVPAIPTSEMVRHGETAGYNVIGHKLSQVEGRTFADAAYRAMVGFAVSDRPGAGVKGP